VIGGVDVITIIVSDLDLVARNWCTIIIRSLSPVELNVVFDVRSFFNHCLIRSESTFNVHLSVRVAQTVLVNGVNSELVINSGFES